MPLTASIAAIVSESVYTSLLCAISTFFGMRNLPLAGFLGISSYITQNSRIWRRSMRDSSAMEVVRLLSHSWMSRTFTSLTGTLPHLDSTCVRHLLS